MGRGVEGETVGKGGAEGEVVWKGGTGRGS